MKDDENLNSYFEGFHLFYDEFQASIRIDCEEVSNYLRKTGSGCKFDKKVRHTHWIGKEIYYFQTFMLPFGIQMLKR